MNPTTMMAVGAKVLYAADDPDYRSMIDRHRWCMNRQMGGQWLLLPILQIVYSAIGLAELGCVLALLGLFDPNTLPAMAPSGRSHR